jgi:hypothetical protein
MPLTTPRRVIKRLRIILAIEIVTLVSCVALLGVIFSALGLNGFFLLVGMLVTLGVAFFAGNKLWKTTAQIEGFANLHRRHMRLRKKINSIQKNKAP